MRFVDEYRAPEQVMQLIEHLRERAALLPIPLNDRYASWKFVVVIPTLFSNSDSTNCCPKTWSSFTAWLPGLRSADGQNRQLC